MSEGQGRGAVAARWWRERLANRESGAARGLMARLRRADALGVLAELAVQDLHSLLYRRVSFRRERIRAIEECMDKGLDAAVERLSAALKRDPEFNDKDRREALRVARAARAAARNALGDGLRGRSLPEEEEASIVRLVRVLAEVREDAADTLARRLGARLNPNDKDSRLVMSHLRFQRLLRAEGEEAATALRRAVVMADRRCNVERLAADLLVWDHPEWGEAARRRWIFDYFAAAQPVGGADQKSEENAA